MKKKMGRAAALIGFAFLLGAMAVGCEKETTTATLPVPGAQGPAGESSKPVATATTGARRAVALVDWYLMVPPDATVPHAVDSSAPTSRWSFVTKFDNADSCKQAVTALQTKNDDTILALTLDPTGFLMRFQKRQGSDPDSERARARVNAAACIATDDPRLKQR